VILAAVLATQARRCRVFVVVAVATGLILTAVTSAIAWAGPSLLVTVAVEHGARYATAPILLIDAALIVAADAYTHRWWPRRRAIAAVAALVAVLAAGWVTDFRYPVDRLSGPTWATTADAWLRYCQHHAAGTITVTFPDYWGRAPLLRNTFSCANLHR
jgi:integral membrane sensor domain MASE1